MALPKFVKFEKDGVVYESGVDRANYTIHELVRAALRDCGRFICREARKLAPKRNKGRIKKGVQSWVKWGEKYPYLQVGTRWRLPNGKVSPTFIAGFFEKGNINTEQIKMITNTTFNNISELRKIQGQYLSAIEDENRALGLIDEKEYISDDDE